MMAISGECTFSFHDHHSYNIVDSPDKAFEGGKAIGRFQAMLSDMPGGPLFETIPWFHNIEKRLQSFNIKIMENPAGRVASVIAGDIRDPEQG